MSSLNKVMLIGRLGADPESRTSNAGKVVTNMRLATSEKWNDKQTGEQVEKTEWHTVVLFGRVAEVAAQYLRKGSLCFIEGKLTTEKWQDKETGADRYTTKVIGDNLTLLGSKDDKPQPAQQAQSRSQGRAKAPPDPAPDNGADFEDDIPF